MTRLAEASTSSGGALRTARAERDRGRRPRLGHGLPLALELHDRNLRSCVEQPRIRATRPSTESSATSLELQTRDPQAANEAWARLDRELADRAIVVPVINPKAVDFVSKRVGNYQRHPVFGMLLSQVWVR